VPAQNVPAGRPIRCSQAPSSLAVTDGAPHGAESPAIWAAELRRTAPVWWNSQRPGVGGFDDGGFWAVTRHADVVAVSRDSDVYSTWENTAIIRHQEGTARDQIELQRFVMLNIDPPQHTKLRGIVSRGFTPRAINNLRETRAERAERLAAAALARGSGDFVAEVACELPLQAIAELLA
jgi:cholest-4-en-3-one 26-monooxygenase